MKRGKTLSEFVVCQICKKQFKYIAGIHTVKHDITLVQYKQQFPKAKTMSNATKLARSGHGGWMQGHNFDHGKGNVCSKCGKIHISPFSGHNYDHNKGDICKKCGKVHKSHESSMKGHNYEHRKGDICKKCGKIHVSGLIENNPAKRPDVKAKISFNNTGEKNGMWKPKVTVFCPVCNKAVEVTLNAAKRFKSCSKKCGNVLTSQSMKINNPMHNPKTVKKMRKTTRKNWSDPVFVRSQLEKQFRRPTNLEKKVILLIDELKLPYEYVGDKSFWIGPCKSGKHRNPDFVHNNHMLKKAILVNGNYWHKDKRKNKEALEDYRSLGYNVLVLWENEQKEEIAEKVMMFEMG